jgi:uracil-DNA glycosylase
MTTQEKIAELEKIAVEVKAFKGLDIAKAANHAVPGEGNPDATIMFIGEAPGFNEDMQGRPFVGQAGKLLEKTLAESLSLKREDVYITNIVKFRPPDNRDPFDNEIAACKDWLDRQIAVIHPRIIATLGRFSMAKFVPDVTISRVHGQPRYFQMPNDNWKILIFPMYHPAAALRAGSMLKLFQEDFVKLKAFLSPSPSLPAEVLSLSKDEVGPTQVSLFN